VLRSDKDNPFRFSARGIVECNIIDSRIKNARKTLLKSVKGIEIGKLSLKFLRCFASKILMNGSRRMNKYKLCKNIPDKKERYEKSGCTGGMLSTPISSKIKSEMKKASDINKFRLLSVIFHTDYILYIDSWWKSTFPHYKEKLDTGTKTGQDYFTTIANKYSKNDIDYYDSSQILQMNYQTMILLVMFVLRPVIGWKSKNGLENQLVNMKLYNPIMTFRELILEWWQILKNFL
jgi:hypothetical protein